MGKYMRKCRSIGEVAVMEVTQVVGVRTRARTLALAAAAAVEKEESLASRSESGELQVAYLQLRSRKLVMTQRISRSTRNSSSQRCQSAERGRISRCSSISSCETAKGDEFRCQVPDGRKTCEDLGSSVCYLDCSRDRRGVALSSGQVNDSGDLESTAERKSGQYVTPSAAEIEEFFAFAERREKQRFAARYNFDVDNEVPLEGRYDWVRLNP
ncbi:Cyclin-dependent kinase inhibitor 3 [Apostasia shenzhenica]|uniref:Cyclin-dependent kinase inhibitor n=1 Tax=Apostasia shenzhenica TaxID=1088818 RepID=A0A2I0A0S5_9ASPA|nr:Cyclin-dependent kinase inhibitor 3 [Apostasia shenzhenica]